MITERLRDHWGRLRHQTGKPVMLGEKAFRLRGYRSSRIEIVKGYEPHLVAPLRRAMEARDGLIVDVGMNLGQTLSKVLSIDPTREYLGFEPQIACCAEIEQFIRDNDLHNCSILPIALGAKSTIMPLYAGYDVDGMATTEPRTVARYDRLLFKRQIPVMRGDDVLADAGYAPPAIIKVDVEGAELSVFESFSDTIQRSRPICFFELLPNYTGHERFPVDAAIAERNRAHADGLLNFFTQRGYKINQIHSPNGNETPIDAFDLDQPDTFIGSDYTAHPIG